MKTIKKTEKGTSYWADNSCNSFVMNNAWELLVPKKGEATTLHGELVRCFGRLNYEYGNNGNCNSVDDVYETCPSCDGSGWEEIECRQCDGDGYFFNDEDEKVDCDCDNGIAETYDCSYCDGECQISNEKEINEYYDDMLYFLEHNLLDPTPVKMLRLFLVDTSKGYGRYSYNDDEMEVYNNLGDEVIRTLANTENKELNNSKIN